MKSKKIGFKSDSVLKTGKVYQLKHTLFLPLIDRRLMKRLHKISTEGINFGGIVDAGGKIAVDKKFRKQLPNFPLAVHVGFIGQPSISKNEGIEQPDWAHDTDNDGEGEDDCLVGVGGVDAIFDVDLFLHQFNSLPKGGLPPVGIAHFWWKTGLLHGYFEMVVRESKCFDILSVHFFPFGKGVFVGCQNQFKIVGLKKRDGEFHWFLFLHQVSLFRHLIGI